MSFALGRKEQHQRARGYMKALQYEEAEVTLSNCIEKWGPHVGPLSDLAVIYYQQGKIDLFELQFSKLEKEFQKATPFLSDSSYINTALILAKLYEEMGLIDKSISCCDQALSKAENIDDIKKILIQKLRLLASLGPSPELSEIYATCVRTSDYPNHLQIELLHGLMLAELHLLGFDSGYERLQQALKILKPDNLLDRNLLLADYLEYELLAFKETRLSKERLASLQQGDSYERTLFKFSQNDFEFSEYEDQLSKMSWLRIVALKILLTPESKNQELSRKFQLIIDSVPVLTHKLLKQKWSFIWKAQTFHKIEVTNESAYYNESVINFGRKKNLKATLLFFCGRSKATLQDFVEIALKESYDPQSYDQVRMILTRIQKDFCDHFGILFPPFYVNKSNVWKNEYLQINEK